MELSEKSTTVPEFHLKDDFVKRKLSKIKISRELGEWLKPAVC
tara:strand:+ start:6797 stop:6925 length:129 start_codon:yes stop_codon:yes gene_type:complete